MTRNIGAMNKDNQRRNKHGKKKADSDGIGNRQVEDVTKRPPAAGNIEMMEMLKQIMAQLNKKMEGSNKHLYKV